MDLINLRLDALEGNLTDIWKSLRFLERTILDLKRGLELMATQTIDSSTEKSLLVYQVAGLAEGARELEERVQKLEEQVSRLFGLLRVIGIVLLVFASVYIAQIVF